jgi:hypothetical protein
VDVQEFERLYAAALAAPPILSRRWPSTGAICFPMTGTKN